MAKAFLRAVLILLLLGPCQSAWADAQPAFREVSTLEDFVKKSDYGGEFRTFYMNRRFHNTAHTDQSLAAGGSLRLETPYWYHLSGGIEAYTSLPLIFYKEEQGGAGLLKTNQHGYFVIGKLYLQAEAFKTRARIFRQELETPFMNSYDYRMTPVTYEAYTVQTWFVKNLELMFSYVTRVKRWTDDKFNTLTSAAGLKGTHNGAAVWGATYTLDDVLKIQAWDYYCVNFMNIAFAQIDATWKIMKEFSATWSAQGIYQHNAGKNLDGKFDAGQLGTQTVFHVYDADITVGYTAANYSHDVINPWGAYPGFTSIMEEDCDLSGERAWIVGLGYDFHRIVEGLSFTFFHTESVVPHGGTFSNADQYESDFNLLYKFHGKLKGLSLKFRMSFVDHSFSTGGTKYRDFRGILKYEF